MTFRSKSSNIINRSRSSKKGGTVIMRRRLIMERKLAKLIQQDIADMVGISQRAYSMIELSQSYGSGQVRDKLVKLFNLPAETLLGVTDDTI